MERMLRSYFLQQQSQLGDGVGGDDVDQFMKSPLKVGSRTGSGCEDDYSGRDGDDVGEEGQRPGSPFTGQQELDHTTQDED